MRKFPAYFREVVPWVLTYCVTFYKTFSKPAQVSEFQLNCRHFGSRAVRTPFRRVAFGRLQVDVGVRDPGRGPERAQQAIAQIFGFVKKHLEKVLL